MVKVTTINSAQLADSPSLRRWVYYIADGELRLMTEKEVKNLRVSWIVESKDKPVSTDWLG